MVPDEEYFPRIREIAKFVLNRMSEPFVLPETRALKKKRIEGPLRFKRPSHVNVKRHDRDDDSYWIWDSADSTASRNMTKKMWEWTIEAFKWKLQQEVDRQFDYPHGIRMRVESFDPNKSECIEYEYKLHQDPDGLYACWIKSNTDVDTIDNDNDEPDFVAELISGYSIGGHYEMHAQCFPWRQRKPEPEIDWVESEYESDDDSDDSDDS